ncbi:MAG: hypothetical protein HY210_00100 [Candidatus Omnitrophica bacterium]|nr:hypothetical protein [Candidatus Omnitrophota bacterium]
MRKMITVIAAIFLAMNMASAGFAAVKKATSATKSTAAKTIKGKIVSIDTANKQITVQEDSTATNFTIKVSASELSSLTNKEGQRVQVTLKSGTSDQAQSIKVLTTKKKKK